MTSTLRPMLTAQVRTAEMRIFTPLRALLAQKQLALNLTRLCRRTVVTLHYSARPF